MARQRRGSNVSNTSSMPEPDQELGSMYDYLAKIILLGPSGSGKSCLLHRFVKSEWRSLTSQTIGVEFASKIIRVGNGPRRQRIKLQLWDTAGTERFRSVSRSYYRGAAGAILVYDVSNRTSFDALPTFLHDARALASPNLTVVLAGNKLDTAEGQSALVDAEEADADAAAGAGKNGRRRGNSTGSDSGLDFPASYASSVATTATSSTVTAAAPTSAPTANGRLKPQPSLLTGIGARQTLTRSAHGRAVPSSHASTWASTSGIPVAVEVSAYTGEGIDDLFARLAGMILTKIELGEIDPDDPASGIQYGDAGWMDGDGGSVRSGAGGTSFGSILRRRGGKSRPGTSAGLREWEEVFRVDKKGRCC